MSFLKTLRTSNGYSQEEFAKTLETSTVSYGNYETGKVKMPVPVGLKISEKFNVSLDDIYENPFRKEIDMELMFRIITTVREIEEEEAEHIDGFRFSNEVFNRLVELVHKRVTKDIKHGETVTQKDIKNNVVELKEFLNAA